MKGARTPYPDPFSRTGRGGLLYFQYTDPRTGNRRQRSTGCTRKTDAIKEIKKFIDDLRADDVPERVLSFADYAAPFFTLEQCPRQARLKDERQEYGERHRQDMRRGIERILGRPGTDRIEQWPPMAFSRILLGKLTRADVYKLRRELSTDPGGRGGQMAYKAVKTVLSEAVVQGHLVESPAVGIGEYRRAPAGSGEQGAEQQRAAFTLEELQTLWKHRHTLPASRYKTPRGFGRDAGTDNRPTITVALLLALGCRVSELRALRWRHVDLIGGTISITEAMKGQAAASGIGLPKTGHRRERLVVPAPLLVDLHQHHALQSAINEVLVHPDVCLVPDPSGGPVGATYINVLWQRVKKNAAALPEDERIDFSERWLTPHSCRHSLNTWTLLKGAPPLQVQEYLGWQSEAGKALAAMQQHYGHFDLAGTAKVAGVIAEILAPEGEDGAGLKQVQ